MLFRMVHGRVGEYLGPVVLLPGVLHHTFTRFINSEGKIMLASNAIIVCPD